jgi:hypothetical protein
MCMHVHIRGGNNNNRVGEIRLFRMAWMDSRQEQVAGSLSGKRTNERPKVYSDRIRFSMFFFLSLLLVAALLLERVGFAWCGWYG